MHVCLVRVWFLCGEKITESDCIYVMRDPSRACRELRRSESKGEARRDEQ